MKSNSLLPSVAGCLLAATVLTGWALASQKAYVRSGQGLCDEVDYELGLSVKSGLLLPEEALRISKRCYENFAENN